MVRLLLLAPVVFAAADREEDSAMLQAKSHEFAEKNDKKMARGLTELWCYRFCGEPIERPHNPFANDVNCRAPKRHPSAHVADMCSRYCQQSNVWTTLYGRKCIVNSGLIVGKLPASNSEADAKAWCAGLSVPEDITLSDGTTTTVQRPTCGSIQHIPGNTKYAWEAVDIDVNENQFNNKCGNHGSWDAYVFTGNGACGRNQKPGLTEKLCGNTSEDKKEMTDFYKMLKGYCSSACVPSGSGCTINPNRLDFIGVTGGSNLDSGDDNCADYCTDAADGTGKCMIDVTEAELCPDRV